MRQYRTSLKRRQYDSRRIMDRYWSDPEFRLECVNRDRAKRGAPLLMSVDEIKTGWSKRPWADKAVERRV